MNNNNNNNNNNDIGPPPVLQRGYAVNIPIENDAIGYEESRGAIGQQENVNVAKDASGASEGKHSD